MEQCILQKLAFSKLSVEELACEKRTAAQAGVILLTMVTYIRDTEL